MPWLFSCTAVVPCLVEDEMNKAASVGDARKPMPLAEDLRMRSAAGGPVAALRDQPARGTPNTCGTAKRGLGGRAWTNGLECGHRNSCTVVTERHQRVVRGYRGVQRTAAIPAMPSPMLDDLRAPTSPKRVTQQGTEQRPWCRVNCDYREPQLARLSRPVAVSPCRSDPFLSS